MAAHAHPLPSRDPRSMSSMSTFSVRLFRMSGRLWKAASLFKLRLWPRDWVPQEPLLVFSVHPSYTTSCAVSVCMAHEGAGRAGAGILIARALRGRCLSCCNLGELGLEVIKLMSGIRSRQFLAGVLRTPYPAIGGGPPLVSAAGHPVQRSLERPTATVGAATAGLEAAHAGIPDVQGHPVIVQAIMSLFLQARTTGYAWAPP